VKLNFQKKKKKNLYEIFRNEIFRFAIPWFLFYLNNNQEIYY